MKSTIPAFILSVSLSAAGMVLAQNPAQPSFSAPPNGVRPPPPIPPLLSLLDANHDGIIDQREIEAASQVLAAAAKNSGDQLTVQDLVPPPPMDEQSGQDFQDDSPQHPPRSHSAGPGRHNGPPPPEQEYGNTVSGMRNGRPPGPPPLDHIALTLLHALDTNDDGNLDAAEIAAASQSLKTLDTDGDGRLTMYELLLPPRPNNQSAANRNTPHSTEQQFGGNETRQAVTQKTSPIPPGVNGISVNISGGYETDRRDGGRPVVLIAAALKVSSDVFRDAFSHVHPATGGREPEPAQVRLNKQALMQSLGPYGITNERLDTVSNYYRYNGAKGEMWRTTPASAYAKMQDGKVTEIVITNPGAGYSTAPTVTIPGMTNLKLKSTLSFGADFAKNGSIQAIMVEKAM